MKLKRSAKLLTLIGLTTKHDACRITNAILYQYEVEKVQKRGTRFVTGNYTYETGSMTGILEQIKLESLKKKMKDSRLIMLYKSLKGAASISTSDLVPPKRRTMDHHSSFPGISNSIGWDCISPVSSPRL